MYTTDASSTTYQTVYPYSQDERTGMIALTIIGGISLLSIVGLPLAMLTVARLKPSSNKQSATSPSFLRSQIGIYFLCLLICNFAQSLAGLLSIKWLTSNAVLPATSICTAQGVMHQFGNVGSALWSLAIAMHTFSLLFLGVGRVSSWACLSTFVIIWFVTGGIVAIGPVLVEDQDKGPFHGLSGPWCWITEEYTGSKLGLEYFWMFFSAIISFILYTLIFLRLRGNIVLEGRSMRFRSRTKPRMSDTCGGHQDTESYALKIARRMLWCPVIYTAIVLPVAVCRWIEFGGGDVPLAATFATDGIFLLSGAINVALFSTTRQITSAPDSLPTHVETKNISKLVISAPQLPPRCHASLEKVLQRQPDSPSTEEGGFSAAQEKKIKIGKPLHRTSTESDSQPRDSCSSEPTRPPSLPVLAPLPRTPPPHASTFSPVEGRNTYSFRPSSPSLRSAPSFQSITPSEVENSLSVPVHLRPIPIVITTPPSPSPSMRTYATATTIDVSRDHRETMMPTLSRF
ncbi:hypothetical protein FS837_003030 [Tulasnella sp. UAMH 9824]|nr:hypothetical protein FS837_003030 [Tulasnella sp. UAMH 9824]